MNLSDDQRDALLAAVNALVQPTPTPPSPVLESRPEAYSSASVTKNTKGYSWEAKVYVPAGAEDTIAPKLEALEAQLRALYAGDVYDSLMSTLELIAEELDDEARNRSDGAVHLSTPCMEAIRAAVNLGTAAKVNG